MKTKKVNLMLKLNKETLREYLWNKHDATLVDCGRNKVKVKDAQGSTIVITRRGREYVYSIDEGRCLQELTQKEVRNYKYVRVQVTFDSIEEAKASPLFKYCVSRHIKKEMNKDVEKYIYKQCEATEDEIAKAGTVEALRAELAKEIEEAKRAQADKFRTDGYLQYLNEFRGLYREMAQRQETLAGVSVAAIAVSIVAAIAGLIALIVVAV